MPGKKTYHAIIPGFLTKNKEAIGPFGRGQNIWRDPSAGVLSGGTESRTDGAYAAW
ncbi:hypothetical protein ABES02_01000 [Neobacillus pocheonensis]|uniref:hypothetical protein n=1 Tax=Neobacillus pocheonensis TaxID=363869 RepID=UPI003D2C7AA0